ncbi:MAG: DUF192 domain-containing protein [Proteobacteria bacterium]|nr:DUF192 domain-containing protein [Pseudomonadota bacterium]
MRSCDTFLARARGQLGAPRTQRTQAWRLHPCRAVHTWFMSAPIDVVFCNSSGVILRIIAPLRPWRCAMARAAHTAWEFPAGAVVSAGLQPGDRLSLSE